MPSHYLLLLHSMFSFQGTSRQKKLHIIRFRRQAIASRRKLIHFVLLPFQIRSASLGSNLVFSCLTLSLKRLNEVSTVIEASFNLLEELKFIRAADSSTSSLFTFNYSLKSNAFEMVGQSGLNFISIILRFASCNRSTKVEVPFCPFSFRKWWAKVDSNHRPHDYQSCALASWAIGPFHDDPCSHFSPRKYGGD